MLSLLVISHLNHSCTHETARLGFCFDFHHSLQMNYHSFKTGNSRKQICRFVSALNYLPSQKFSSVGLREMYKKKKNTYDPDSEVNNISKGETRQREHELICQSWPETWLRTGSDILYHMFLPDLRHADYLSLSTSNAHGDRCPESSPNDPHIGKNVENMERKKESPALEGLITTSLCVRVGWKCEVVILVSCHTADNRLFHKS